MAHFKAQKRHYLHWIAVRIFALKLKEFFKKLRPLLEKTADVIFLDGTFWSKNEMLDLGLSKRNALDMGHVPISGEGGSLEWFRQASAVEKVYVHINNTNPVLNTMSKERKVVDAAGIRIGRDGAEFRI